MQVVAEMNRVGMLVDLRRASLISMLSLLSLLLLLSQGGAESLPWPSALAETLHKPTPVKFVSRSHVGAVTSRDAILASTKPVAYTHCVPSALKVSTASTDYNCNIYLNRYL
jgi:hypothetical protein